MPVVIVYIGKSDLIRVFLTFVKVKIGELRLNYTMCGVMPIKFMD